MTRTCSVLLATTLTLLTAAAAAAPAEAQILRDLKKAVSDVKDAADEVREVRCEAQGICGEVRVAEHFAPEMYVSLAVTYFDTSGRYRGAASENFVRNAFEGQLIENGFLLASSSDVSQVQERIARSDDGWSDEALAQLRDFVEGIDAVVVVQVDQLELAQCEVEEDQRGVEVTAHLSARWLNPDAGDIPWLGTHAATVCEGGGTTALNAALEKVSAELSGMLPTLTGSG